MRVDLFLKLIGITKTRMAAKRLCDSGKVLIGPKPLKPSREILAGEILEIFLPQRKLQIKVLEVPPDKSVSKKDRKNYFTLLSSLEE